MVRVAVDARRLQDLPLTGVGRWLANLLPHLAREVDLVLLTDARREAPPGAWTTEPLRLPPGVPEVFWLQVNAARWLRGFQGVFHGTYNAVPFARRGPSVVSIYDLSWEHHPEDFTDVRRRAYAAQARWSARAASVVVTVSAHARRAIVDTYGIAESQVVVAPPAVDPIFSPARAEAVGPFLERFGVSPPYVVALGGARRRGVEVAVEAWRRLPRGAGAPSLVVVG
ncbi:MAG: glycosyltransferase, partial [Acidimicrobiales bacterium]